MPTTHSDSQPTKSKTSRRRRWIWLLGIPGLIILLGAITTYFALPQLGSRPVANVIKCASNLRQIGQAILMYTQDHHGQYPDTFRDILLDGNIEIDSSLFVCQSTNDTPAEGPTTQAIADNLHGDHLSYIYAGRGLTDKTVTADTILAFEPLTNHDDDGMNVLFGDGHVDFVRPPQANEIIARWRDGKFPKAMPTER